MASLTRKFLRDLGMNDEQVAAVIKEHTDVVDTIRDERDALNKKAARLDEVQTKLDEAENKIKQLEKAGGDAAKVQAEYDAYKKQVEADKDMDARRAAFKPIMEACGITRDSYQRAVLHEFDLSKEELKDGKYVNEAAMKDRLTKDFADFAGKTSKKGADTTKPPTGGGKTMTRDEIMKMTDTKARQKAIAENIELFQPGAEE